MGFFERGTDGGAESGLPAWFDSQRELTPVARGRLERTARSGVGASTLSAKEFALLGPMGPQPIGEVLGACAYRLGTQRLPAEAGYAGEDYSGALHTLNDAWSDARRLAFGRLDEEARALGADAVLGVHLQRTERGWTQRGIDYAVIGTAVRIPRPARSNPSEGGLGPVLSDLSVQDYWTLRAAGCDPAGLLAATAVMFVSQGLGTRWRRRRTMIQNGEFTELAEAFSDARHMAVRDIRDQAKRLGAEGVVGVSFAYDHSEHEFRVDSRGAVAPSSTSVATTMLSGESVPSAGGGDKRAGTVFTVHVVGTAIRRRPAAAAADAPIVLALDLNEP
jgi:uncharacterized protein YbjQ (UPF0145 family)